MRTLLFMMAALFSAAGAWAGDRSPWSTPLRTISPVNVERRLAVVSGTVTVRAAGVPVNPPEVTYSFTPDFSGSGGSLPAVGNGQYRLQLGRVPNDVPRTLTLRAAFNDQLIRDGVVIRRGRTYAGSVRLSVPPGTEIDLGQILLDLN